VFKKKCLRAHFSGRLVGKERKICLYFRRCLFYRRNFNRFYIIPGDPALIGVALTSLLLLPEMYKVFSIEERQKV